MNLDTALVEKTFRDYSDSFKLKKPSALIQFYKYPALLMDRHDDRPKILHNRIVAFFGLWRAMRRLKKGGYVESKLLQLKVQGLSNDLAVVSGSAERLGGGGKVIDEFDYSYTLCLRNKSWKIVAGFLYPKQDS